MLSISTESLSPLDAVPFLASRLREGLTSATSDNLVKYTSVTRVEPVVLLEESIRHQAYATDILQTLTSIFAGYYTQAIAISIPVARIDVIKLLDKVNPRRNLGSNLAGAAGYMLTQESYQHRLPFATAKPGVGMEALGNDIFGAFRDQGQEYPKDDTSKQSFGRDTISNIQLDTNLCVGKQLEIVLEDQGNKAVIPVTVRLAVNTVDTESMIHNLTLGGRQMTGKERGYRWKENELDLVRDIFFVEDIIKQHRRALIKDKSGFFQDTLKRRRENRLSAIASGSASVADASSMVVLTARTAKEIESRLGGKLSNMKVRQQLFDETAIMLMVVINDDWGKVTIYHNSIDLPTSLSLTEVKNAAKGSGPDIGEILKAYQLGSAPSF